GGPGRGLVREPVFAAVEAVQAKAAEPGLLVMLTPTGERLTQPLVKELSQSKRLLLLCGRYEGFDERIRLGLRPREVSIGDFVCNGGEGPALGLVDTAVRFVPGALGAPGSAGGGAPREARPPADPPHPRPPALCRLEVPEVLLSGNHQAVARWRQEQSQARSRPAGRPGDTIEGDQKKEGDGP